MTVPSISSVGGRIAQIQSQFDRNMSPSQSFAETLKVAQQPTVAPGARFSVAPLRSPATTGMAPTPIGILGTPVVFRGNTAAVSANGSWIGQLPTAGQSWATEIERAATSAGLDPRLLAAMVWQESGFRPDAVSHSGAIGLAQLMPGTADGLDVDPWDPVQNLEGGARYLAWTIEEFGSIELGLAAYNAGPGRVREADGIPNIAETQAYVPRVLDYYRKLGGIE
jgi:hypothetical protein